MHICMLQNPTSTHALVLNDTRICSLELATPSMLEKLAYVSSVGCLTKVAADGIPLSSSPRRPARPLIWIYSPDVSQRKAPPSHLRAFVKATVLAGMLRPVEKVSVANNACSQGASNSQDDCMPFLCQLAKH